VFFETLMSGGGGFRFDLRARGLTRYNVNKRIWDFGGGVGGPLKRDTLWFYSAVRDWGNEYHVAGNFANKTPNTLFCEPDLNTQAEYGRQIRNGTGRVTWQAAQKHKITFSHMYSLSCNCPVLTEDGSNSPDGAYYWNHGPENLSTANWSHPATNRFLLEVGVTYWRDNVDAGSWPGIQPTDRRITETTIARSYGRAASEPHDRSNQKIVHGTLSYVTGSHAFKVGFDARSGSRTLTNSTPLSETYTFRNQVPLSITQVAVPHRSLNDMNLILGM
jgi:hypothetical protein